jgi:DNA-binding LytR/AlgR family response regulator
MDLFHLSRRRVVRAPARPTPAAGAALITITVVEDEPAHAERLVEQLRRYAGEKSLELEIAVLQDAEQLVADYGAGRDILFLDIEMPGMDGFSAAQRIRELDPGVIIVFVTHSGRYAMRGYEVEALSYLLKPVSYYALAHELNRSIARLRRRDDDSLMLKLDGALARVRAVDVVSMESRKHNTVLHTLTEKRTLVASLTQMETLFDGRGFFRSNNCYLVNLRHVVGVQQNMCVMVDGRQLAISRPRKRAFLEALADHMAHRTPGPTTGP